MLIAMLAALVAVPQDPPTTGFLMELPISILEDSPGADLEMIDADGALVPLSTFDPTLTIAQLVGLPGDLTINSFSRGTGAMYSDWENGYVFPVVGLNGWSFMVFSVSGDGWDPATPYAQEIGAGGVEGDVFSYIIEGSEEGFPSDEVGTLHKIHDGNQLQVGRLAGLDTYFPAYALDDDHVTAFEEVEGAVKRPFYFTIFSASGDYAAIPGAWVDGDASLKQPSTIFEVTLEGGIGDPHVYRTAADIGLDSSDIIDALTVMDPQWDLAPGDTLAQGIDVLVGIDSDKWNKKLHVHGTWTDDTDPLVPIEVTYSGPLRDSSGGIFVQTELRLNGVQQRIRASCGDDPAGDTTANHPRFELRRERTAFVSRVPTVSFPGELDYSFHQLRRLSPGVSARYRATLRGFVGRTDYRAQLMCWGSGFEKPTTPGVVCGYVMRDPNSATGDKQHYDLKIPLSGSPRDLRFQWWVESRSRIVGKSEPFVIRAR